MDAVELYQDGPVWRWRRLAPNGADVSTSEESWTTKAKATKAAKEANPDPSTYTISVVKITK